MVRGDRFARGVAPRADADGHAFPSDRSMRFIELQLLCKLHPEGRRPILGAWWIESHFDAFDSSQVNERANKDVETQVLTDAAGETRLRFKMTCPKCGQTPVSRQDRIDDVLAANYEQGAYAKVIQQAI